MTAKRKGKGGKPAIYEEERRRLVRKSGPPKSELELQKKIDKEERGIKEFFKKFLKKRLR